MRTRSRVTLASLALALAAGAILVVGPTASRSAAAAADPKGTATCEKRSGEKREILKCWEDITEAEARKLCYDGYGGNAFHFQTKGPTCFAILSKEVPWP